MSAQKRFLFYTKAQKLVPSVRPVEYEANDFGGYTFTKWELIECSKVELPMNPEAVDSAKSYTFEEAADWLLS